MIATKRVKTGSERFWRNNGVLYSTTGWQLFVIFAVQSTYQFDNIVGKTEIACN